MPGCTLSRASLARTRQLAQEVAALLRRGDVVLLIGDLGAGKTAFTKALAGALGVEEDVTSPTFTLMRHYPTATTAGTLLHIDAYRLEGPAGLEDLGIEELLDDGVAVIEWGDLVAAAIGPDHLDITFTWVDEEHRAITIEPHGASWKSRLQ